MDDAAISNDKLTTINFHLFQLKFTPYKDSDLSSSTILSKVITYVSQELQQGKGHLIDKNHNRDNEPPRELFINHAVIMAKERRIRCSMALLRAGRMPMLKPADTFTLIPLSSNIGSIAEETHFFIDYSTNRIILCVEFNYHGPRMSDIEYYLRNVAHNTLKLSKATEVVLFMDTQIDKAIAELKNVLNIDIKMQPKKIKALDTVLVGQYFTGINNLGNNLKPKFIKLEAMFQSPGSNVKSEQINVEANNMFLKLLRGFKSRPDNIGAFDNFVVKYEDKDGKEGVFNLLNGKAVISKEIDLATIRKVRQWYELIEKDFDDFVDQL